MIEFRRFQNTDLPRLVRLWHQAGLGRGAAGGFGCDVFDDVVVAQTYFDRDGLIVAVDGTEVVGFAHAGFGPTRDESTLQFTDGVICMVIVHPAHRRQGIGRELVRRAEAYLRDRGATSIQAGASPGRDPFYCGIYGGAESSGLLESEPFAIPFFESMDYVPKTRRLILQRDLETKNDPVSLRLLNARRATRLDVPELTQPRTWWWQTRRGRLDSLDFALIPKSGGEPLAQVTVVGLDFYIPCWGTRAAGLVDLRVRPDARKKGFGQACLIEVCRHFRQEMISLVEAHVPADDTPALAVFACAGFSPVDSAVVYEKC